MGMDISIERIKGIKISNYEEYETYQCLKEDCSLEESIYDFRKRYWLNTWFVKRLNRNNRNYVTYPILSKIDFEDFLTYCNELLKQGYEKLGLYLCDFYCECYTGFNETWEDEVKDVINKIQTIIDNEDFINNSFQYWLSE